LPNDPVPGSATTATAHQLAFERLLTRLAEACDRSEWPVKINGAIDIAVDFAIARPEHFRIVFPGPTSADLAADVSTSHERLAQMLAGARAESPHATELPDSTELFLVIGSASVIASWLSNGRVEERRSLQRQLAELLLLPYYGRAKAAEMAGLNG
jgi:hypothetical protein